MLVLNFAHPLTDEHLAQIAVLAGRPVERVIAVPTQFDHVRPFLVQVREQLTTVGFTPDEWQTLPLVVNLPSLSIIAGIMLAELHGRCGYFPTVLQSRPVVGSNPVRYEVIDLVKLQAVRDTARSGR